MYDFIKNKIKAFIISKASANKMIDIVEVRTREIGLTQVTTETDIRIVNSFFLPLTILSIKTELMNRDGLKVGSMSYEQPQKIKGKSDEILTATSQISIITSLFQALTTLLMQDIHMRSVGVARIKILWFITEIPIDDTFIIHPKKVKIIKDLTDEEKLVIAHDQEINSVIRQQEIESKNIEIALRNAERKERMLKDRYKDNYISKAERLKLAKQAKNNDKIENETVNTDNMNIEFTDIELDEKAVLKMAEDSMSTDHNKI